MSEPGGERDEVEVLASEFVQRHRDGERPTVAEYAAKYPALADDIRELFPTIAAMERLKLQKEPTSSGPVSLGGKRPERLGEFHIVREIARGGMGVVFEAEQESLARRVAVKVLPQNWLLTPEAVARFRREAQIAARLHHPNIVPIFAFGESDGLYYYVMPLIQGVGLHQVVARLAARGPTAGAAETTVNLDTAGRDAPLTDAIVRRWPPVPSPVSPAAAPSTRTPALDSRHADQAARMILQVARALDYAHTQGTLHCDIKPGNLLLDAEGTVHVTDFGVAKAFGFDRLTRTGNLGGTLQYMAPERFRGQLDPRSDIYSLGLTLYELLTLEPAFGAGQRQEMIGRILEGAPFLPGSCGVQIPRDLETIVRMATAHDPQDRYGSAKALADDLQRYLDGQPIAARPPGLVGQAWKWLRRNPLLAGLALAVVILTAFLLVSGPWLRPPRPQLSPPRSSEVRDDAPWPPDQVAPAKRPPGGWRDEFRPGDGPQGPARRTVTKSGVVTEFYRSPNGETDGLRLDDGTEVRFPPGAGESVTDAVSLRDRVTIEGWVPPGESELRAATIKNEASGKLVVLHRPPPEFPPGGQRRRRGGPEDGADDDRRPPPIPPEGHRPPGEPRHPGFPPPDREGKGPLPRGPEGEESPSFAPAAKGQPPHAPAR